FEENEFLLGAEYLTPLYNYIKNEQVIKIQYQSFKSNQIQSYTISPYHLKQYNKRWFLFGRNHVSAKLQNLALDRIKSINPINIEFSENTIDFDEYFEDIVGVSNDVQKETAKVKILLSDNIIPYILSKPVHGSQKVHD